MSSSNAVSLTYTPEVKYGVKADATTGITADTVRFTSESLSGSPQTTESASIRQDRQSAGMIVTGLDVGGSIDFELAKDKFFDDFFGMSMMSSWQAATGSVASASFTPNVSDDQKGTIAATGVGAGMAVGDVVIMTEAGGEKSLFTVIAVTNKDSLQVASKRGQAGIASASSQRPSYMDIGKDITSVTMGKAYKDVVKAGGVDEESQTYSGSIVSGFNLSAETENIVTGSFTMVGNGYDQEAPSREQNILTGGGTINAAGTSNPLNGSLDIPVVTADGLATDFCIESFSLSLDNGLTPNLCLGRAAPTRYELGQATINVDLNVYNSETSYERFMPAKLSMVPISFSILMQNDSGGYAFTVSALQLSGSDPSSGGSNSSVMLNMSGTARVGLNGESALRIYRL